MAKVISKLTSRALGHNKLALCGFARLAFVTACRIGSTKPAPPPLPMMMFLNPACFAVAAVADPTTKAGFEIHVVASAVLATASTAWRLVKIMPVKSAGFL